MFSTNKGRSMIYFKGKWNADFDNPVVLELGCKGEYSVGLAERYPNKNHWN
jgi:tRNA G46 methylase TrmB